MLITLKNFQIAFDFVRDTAMYFFLGKKCLTSSALLAVVPHTSNSQGQNTFPSLFSI